MVKVCVITSCKNTASGFLLLIIWQTFLVLSRIFLSSRPSTFHDKTVKFGLLCSSFCSLWRKSKCKPLGKFMTVQNPGWASQSYAMSGHNVRIHPHNENLESPRPRHLSFKQLCNIIVKHLENHITLCISHFRLWELVRYLLSFLFDSHRAKLKTRMQSLELFLSTWAC